MQNTRLNTVFDRVLEQSSRWLQNPWRRVSLVVISLLLGNFLATGVATISGQQADWDVVVAILLVTFTEATSWIVYRNGRNLVQSTGRGQRGLLLELVNALKLGLTYGMFVEALKLGS